jgi:hypothetical protein
VKTGGSTRTGLLVRRGHQIAISSPSSVSDTSTTSAWSWPGLRVLALRRKKSRDGISPVRAVLTMALAIAGVGCSRVAETYTPEIAGVVASQQSLSDGSYDIVLEDGRSLNVDPDRQRIIIGGAAPTVGDLVLAGTSPKPWVARLERRFECFWIGGDGIEEGGYITGDRGLRLREAANFERGAYAPDQHEFHAGGFCVNSSGEITAVK